MADLAIGVARSVVEGTLTKAQTAIEEEKKLRRDAQRDLIFITGEFQMTQSFLRMVDEERGKNPVIRAWVDQARDLAYDVEDCIELVDHLDSQSDWWRRLLPGCVVAVLPLDNVVGEIRLLKARIEDVSNRCTHYGLLVQQQPTPNVAVSAREVDDTTFEQLGLRDLTQLIIANGGSELGVISLWGRRDNFTMSIIRKAYGDQKIRKTFGCRGWVKLEHPFNPRKFLQSVLGQLYTNTCLQQGKTVDVVELERREAMVMKQGGFVEEFNSQVNNKRYLLVLENLCAMEDWDAIRACLPESVNANRIIVSTNQREIARLCIGHSYQVLELKQHSSDYPVCVFFKQSFHGEIDGRAVKHDVKAARRYKKEFILAGREAQMKELRSHQTMARFNDWHVMSVWGIAGVGKSALVKNFYYDIIMLEENSPFQKYGWINVVAPLNLMDFSRKVLVEFDSESHKHVEIKNTIQQCCMFLKEYPCLLVIDGLQSMQEWDLIQNSLVSRHSKSLIIVITTQENIATYCAYNEEIILNVRGLEEAAAFHLFREKVSRRNPYSVLLNQKDGELRELILRCGGLPEVIIYVADFLAHVSVRALENVRSLNQQFMYNLMCNPEFCGRVGLFRWLDSYIGTCPDFLKQCILYLPVFSHHQSIRRRRMLRRWIAEGYIRDSEESYAEERGEWSFSKLLNLCMVHPPPHSVSSIIKDARTVLFQINKLVGQYILSGPKEENLFLELEKNCIIAPHRIGRHLIVRGNWVRDRTVFESIDFLRLRSLTVFGRWESFFVSESMKVLRVLDLEDSTGVTDKDLEEIVKLLSRLKFLSLRGCREICRLPHALGDLRQLETLDVRHTSVATIPKTIIKLKKLQYLRVGMTIQSTEQLTQRTSQTQLPHQFGKNQPLGVVKLPEGMDRLTLLSTLGVISISAAPRKLITEELRKLNRLRKLGVTGVSMKNSKEFIDTISGHVHLESLSVWLCSGNQQCSLEGPSSPPENLQTLKLYGLVNAVPSWIKDLQKITKLELEMTTSNDWIEESGIIRVLGDLKELTVLRLSVKPLQDGDSKLNFRFWRNEAQRFYCRRVKILEVACSSNLNLAFGPDSMNNLELLTVRCSSASALEFCELNNLSELNEVQLIGAQDSILEDLRTKLNKHPRRPVLNS